MAYIYENRGTGPVSLENGNQDRTLANGSVITLEENDETLSKLFSTPKLLRHKIRSVPGGSSTFVDVYDELTLSEDTGVAGSVKWNCLVNNSQVTDFLLPATDVHYTIIVKDGRGNVVSSSLYSFDYSTGVLTFTTRPLDQGFVFPFRAKLYKSSPFNGGGGVVSTGSGSQTGLVFTQSDGTQWIGFINDDDQWEVIPYP